MEIKIGKNLWEKLYDPGRKMRFVEECGSTQAATKNLLTLFLLSGASERELNKDISIMSEDEVNHILDQSSAYRMSTRYRYVKTLRAYRKWCSRNGFEAIPIDYRKIYDVDSEVIRKRFVSGPMHLQSNLDLLFDSVEKQSTENIYRAMFWLAFSGIDSEDACDLLCGEIDFVNQRISHDGKDYPLYFESVPVMRFLVESDTINYYNKNYVTANTGGGYTVRKRVAGDKLLRGIRGNPSINTITGKIKQKVITAQTTRGVDIRMTYLTVQQSGKFYREHMRETVYGMVNLDALVDEKIAESGQQFDSEEAYRAYRNNQRYQFKQVYEAWLFAFGM